MFSAAAVLLALLVLESAARIIEVFEPPLVVDAGLGFDAESRVFLAVPGHPRLVATNEAKRRVFRRQEFLREKAPGTLRVAALGGSSVNFLDDELQVLRTRLRARYADRYSAVEILNCGGKSYGTHRLLRVLQELLALDLDLLLVYTGHNEFEELEQEQYSRPALAPLARAVSHLALVRVPRDFFARPRIAELRAERAASKTSDHPDLAPAWTHEFTMEEVKARMREYRANLGSMITLCREADVPVVIGTVPSNLVRPYLPRAAVERYAEAFAHFNSGEWEEGLPKARAILRETAGRHQASDLENAIVREVAAQHGVALADVEQVTIDAEPHGVPGETLFEDHTHLNGVGRRLWREVYEARIAEVLAR